LVTAAAAAALTVTLHVATSVNSSLSFTVAV
jgi:hypothetical protein